MTACDTLFARLRRLATSGEPCGCGESVRHDTVCYGSIVLVVFVLALGTGPDSVRYFQRFLGGLDPRAAVAIAALLGAIGLATLGRRAAFRVAAPPGAPRGALRIPIAAALAFGAAIVAADVLLGYPSDINVPMPHALIFYPVIGFIAEIAFHVVPMAVVGSLASLIVRGSGGHLVTCASFIAAALSEPLFQVVLGGSALSTLGLYTGVHVLAFSVVQLLVFRRFGFAMMLLLRLAYYAIWHIGWGVIRLEVLFAS